MNFQNIFLNSDNRLRSGWRFGVFLISFSAIAFALNVTLFLFLTQTGFTAENHSFAFMIASNLVTFISALALGWLWGMILEGLPLRALGVSFSDGWLKNLILGLIFGTLAMLLAVLIAAAFGNLRFEYNALAGSAAKWATLGSTLALFVVGAAAEEILFRGYMLQTFARANLAWFAILLTSLFFAFVHLGNPGANWISSVNTGLAGIMFGAAYLKTRTLWFPFALHLMWNWIQGAIFGIPVSGIKDFFVGSLFKSIDAGPVWLTGGDYGIEGGAACTAALIVTSLVIWFTPLLKASEEMLELTSAEKFADPKEDVETVMDNK